MDLRTMAKAIATLARDGDEPRWVKGAFLREIKMAFEVLRAARTRGALVWLVAALVVVAEDGAGAVIGRPFLQAGAAQRVCTGIEGEGLAAAGAAGSGQPSELAPAIRAEALRRAQDIAAFQAARRQHRVEHGAGHAAGEASQTCQH